MEATKAAVEIIKAIADTIKELKRVPNGELWAHCMGKMSFNDYQKVIDILKGAGLIKEINNELIWVL